MENDVVRLIEQLEVFINNVDTCCCYLQKYNNRSVLSVPISWGDKELKDFVRLISRCLHQQFDDKDSQLREYPTCDFQGDIEFISEGHEAVKEEVNYIYGSLEKHETFSNDILSFGFNGYAFELTKDDEQLLFLAKKKPVVNLTRKGQFKISLFKHGDKFVYMGSQFLQFVPYMDTIIYRHNLYFLTPAMQAVMGLDNYRKRLKMSCIQDLEKALPARSFNQLKKVFSSPQGRFFASYNKQRLKKLANISQYPILAQRLQIKLDSQGNMILDDELSRLNVLKYLQNRIGINIDDLDRNVYSQKPLQDG